MHKPQKVTNFIPAVWLYYPSVKGYKNLNYLHFCFTAIKKT